MVNCIGPVIVGTVFWILQRPLNTFAAIYFFIVFWYQMLLATSAHSRWCSEHNPLYTLKEKKRKKRFEFLFMQVVLLSVPAFLLLLCLLYDWFPLPGWIIAVFSVFGVIYLIGTLTSFNNEKK